LESLQHVPEGIEKFVAARQLSSHPITVSLWERDPKRPKRVSIQVSQVMWMWHDVHKGDDDQDADLDAQLRSPDGASLLSNGDERDAF
jgi:hypothetical protein